MAKQNIIGIDVHSIGTRAGGNETYYRELIKELLKIRCDHRFLLYYISPLAAKQIAVSHGAVLKRLAPAHCSLRIPFTLPWRSKCDHLDLFHAQFIVPPFLKCKTVTTIPDIAYEHFPQFFPASQRAFLKVLVRESAKKADHIITVSQYSKRDLVETYGIKPEKITVTYEGAGDEFGPRNKDQAKENLRRKYGLDWPFILYVGRLQARKNLARLVRSYAEIRKTGIEHKLVLAGRLDSLFRPVISLVRDLGLESDVVFPGYIDAAELPDLYSAADVFVYPSLYEGFGLPVIEAMACGTPVITSRGSSLEEVAGQAAVLVDALDEESITSALRLVLSDGNLRERLHRAAIQRSHDFSFKNAARQTLSVYEFLLGEKMTGSDEELSPDLSLERGACR